MTAGFVPPDHWTERAGQLKTSQSITLNAAGNGVISSVVTSTNQNSAAVVVPYATLALNTTDLSTMSQGNQRGTTYSGQQNTFSGALDVGPCDFMSVLFYPPPGSTAGQIAALAGIIATVVITGTRYTRRA
jgi:hypothetical protein